jgi:hypothetical protein
MSAPTLAGLSGDARALLSTLAAGDTWTQRDVALAALGLAPQAVRRVQAAIQEARLAGWPIVSDGDGVRLETDPAAVLACAAALRRRAVTQWLTARALRRTGERMRAPATLWEDVA